MLDRGGWRSDLLHSSESMAKFKRTRRAKNKVAGSIEGALIKVDPVPDPTAAVYRSSPVAVSRSTVLNAELEEVIEIIATERVYRAMLASFRRRLLMAPLPIDESPAT